MENSKKMLFVGLGVAFWFFAAMIVRFGNELFFSEGSPYLLPLFIATIPISYGFLFVTMKLGKLKLSELLKPVTIIVLTAMLCDGIAMTWFGQLYGKTNEIVHFGAAFILWGVFVGLCLAYLHSNEKLASSSKMVIFIILGIVFWFSGAITVNLLGNSVFSANNPLIFIAYILAFPISYLFLLISKKIGKINNSEILKAVVIMTFAATFFDGIALTWFRQIYGNLFEHTHYGAAWILWGGGAGLLLGYIMSNKK